MNDGALAVSEANREALPAEGAPPQARAPEAQASAARLPYLAGLDGLRALAVAAVFAYHLDYAWLPGGFLGVDVFFVLSGYLITALLLGEWQERGRVDLRGFWLRRARRLLPAVVALLAGVLAFTALRLPYELEALRTDALAALGYVTNWWLIAEQQSYFEAMGRPSMLQHLWSLAVEEQFYLVWPAVFVLLMRYTRRAVPWVLLLGAAASTLAMALLFDPDADPSRLYYGTDTRAAALLLGAALACAWRPAGDGGWHGPRWSAASAAAPRRWLAGLLDVAGVAALALLALLLLRLNEFDPLLYQGGFALVALVTAGLVAAVAHPQARVLPRMLGVAPLRWLGTRSYGIYLWHWPVLLVTRPHLDVPLDGPALLALRIALTLGLAELCYVAIERPIRAWRPARRAQSEGARCLGSWRPRSLAAASGAGVATVAVVGALLVAPGIARGDAQAALDPRALGGTPVPLTLTAAPPTATPRTLVHATATPLATPATAATPATPAPAPAVEPETEPPARASTPAPDGTVAPEAPLDDRPSSPSSASAASTREQPADASPTAATPGSGPPPEVTAVGDSVLLGAAQALADAIPGIELAGEVGLQAGAAVELVRSLRDSGRLGDAVVLHVGSNGVLRQEEFEQLMELLAGVERVVILNVKVPRPWEDPNNQLLADAVSKHPNAVLIDWRATSAGEASFFWDDGVHLRPEGAEAYAALITQQLPHMN